MKNAEPRRALQFRVQLEEIEPPVWRRILVPDHINLLELHEILQETFGWEDYHLHQYTIRGTEYGDPQNDEYDEMDIHDETAVPLRELGLRTEESFTYTYDFGDNWTHTLRLEKVVPVEGRKRLPRCVAGARACPPEDVGGTGGYAEFLVALADPEDPEHEHYREWAGGSFDAEAFDLRDANRRLADRAAARRAPMWGGIPERYRDAPLEEPSVWEAADRRRHMATARDLPLRRDVVAFLGYLRDHRITGTTARGNLPLKAVAEVADAFVEPPPMELRLGNSVYPVRSEEGVWPVYFVHLLASAADLIRGGPNRRWRLTKRGERYLSAPADLQVRALLAGWWYHMDWTAILNYNVFGDTFSSEFPRSALSLFRQLDVGQRREYEPFVDRFINEVGLRWDAEGEESERIRSYVGSALESMLIEPLESLGVLACQRTEDENRSFAWKRLKAFSVTAFGRMLLDSLQY